MTNSTPTPTSRLGRLLVEHDRGLGLGPSLWPLGEVRVGERVTAVAEITGFKAFTGRVQMILDDGHGGSAMVTIGSAKPIAAFRAAGFAPRVGVRVEVRGEAVQPPIPTAPRGIEARFIRVVA